MSNEPKLRVLITDDKAEMRKLVRLSLDLDNIELYEAETGESALETVMHIKPQLVLMDVMMPGDIDGLRACRWIKDAQELAGTIVIMLSARAQRSDIEAGRMAGADDYIVKPFSPTKLRETVSSYLLH